MSPSNLLQFGDRTGLTSPGGSRRGRIPRPSRPRCRWNSAVAAGSGRQVAAWGSGAGAETNSASVSGWSGGADDARRVRVRPASADVGVRLRVADRLRQRGQPDAGAGCEPAAAYFCTDCAGRAAVAADLTGTDGECGPGDCSAEWWEWGLRSGAPA